MILISEMLILNIMTLLVRVLGTQFKKIIILYKRRKKMQTYIIFILLVFMVLTQEQSHECLCKNGGSCIQLNNENKCLCRPQYFGSLCQTTTNLISNNSKWINLNESYTFFSFAPAQPNFYKFIFQICMKSNPEQLENLIFMEVQQPDQNIEQQPSFFSTAKIQVKQGRCISFSTEFIEIKNTNDITLPKIVFGIRTSNKSFKNYFYRSLTGKNQKDLITEDQNQEYNQLSNGQWKQRLSLKANIETYQQTKTQKIIKTVIKTLLFVIISFFVSIFGKIILYSYNIELKDIMLHQLNIIRKICRKICSSPDTKRYIEYLNGKMHDHLCPKDQLHRDQCSICLQSFDKDEIIRETACNHIYHQSCLDGWSLKHQTCPLCRQSLHSKNKGWFINFLEG